ncbi:MAG: alcohol dehydrogenase catalytic domain-containing protein [Chloroflexia bacterium]|nr:alcohol dehydrogenase catalytic domain-containing protein [Chloroflexia bacterium]
MAGIIPGHEPSGVVYAGDDGVTNVRVGDCVAVYHSRSCGHCQESCGGDLMWCADRRGYGGPLHPNCSSPTPGIACHYQMTPRTPWARC